MTVQAAGLLDTRERDVPRVRLPLVNQFLDLQQDLTAVERFSRRHEEGELPGNERLYKDLIPLAKPVKGQQYAFQVDLDSCTGCKACVAGCHSMNGLDETETWRSVGMLHGGTPMAPVQATVTTACHHCVEPACMTGCPVEAYEKDPVTGIVNHLDDQCIGCQYCTLTCPYEVPRFNERLGIVRKCDMCSDRLKAGEAPACVQACPNGAIAITVVEQNAVRADAARNAPLPSAPSPAITFPTTQYKASAAFPQNFLPADFHRVRPAHQHLPLVVMLVLTQLSAGAFLIDALLPAWLDPTALSALRPLHVVVALGFGLLALAASTAHLGRPLYAFRALLGLRHSWLSREVLAFGVFTGLAAPYVLSVLAARFEHPLLQLPLVRSVLSLTSHLGTPAVAAGLCGVFTSVMVYHATRRHYWHARRTGVLFAGTTLLLGATTSLLTASAAYALLAAPGSPLGVQAQDLLSALCAFVVALAPCKLIAELLVLTHVDDARQLDMWRSARLLAGELRPLRLLRMSCALIGGVLLPLLLRAHLTSGASPSLFFLALGAWVLLLSGELLERGAFFRALASPRMPGALG